MNSVTKPVLLRPFSEFYPLSKKLLLRLLLLHLLPGLWLIFSGCSITPEQAQAKAYKLY
jgi:hypothetical protein